MRLAVPRAHACDRGYAMLAYLAVLVYDGAVGSNISPAASRIGSHALLAWSFGRAFCYLRHTAYTS